MKEQFIGTWILASWHNELDDGSKTYPFGPDASGYISYSADGFVFVHIMTANRTLYAYPDPFTGTLEEDSAAMKSQITYAGTYEFIGDKIVHHATISSFPNWVGSDQVRDYHIDGDTLELSASDAQFQDQNVTARLIWTRAV